jgi:hypothetical protein
VRYDIEAMSFVMGDKSCVQWFAEKRLGKGLREGCGLFLRKQAEDSSLAILEGAMSPPDS